MFMCVTYNYKFEKQYVWGPRPLASPPPHHLDPSLPPDPCTTCDRQTVKFYHRSMDRLRVRSGVIECTA